MQLAPIVLFVYNRPWLTEQTLNALASNDLADQSALYIYSDGPKKDATPKALEHIKTTRELIREKKWCREVHIIERKENYGLQRSIIEGVTELVNKYGRVIVLEDDIVPSEYFLQYMNDALNVYADEQKIISIGAFNFFATDDEVKETFFIPIPDCWGWATWRDRWQLFEPNAQTLLNRLRENGLIQKFNLNGAFDFESMLIDQVQGKISSWAIRWQAVAYLENKLALYPKYSVTQNIGFGEGGTHGGEDKFSKKTKFAIKKINVEKMPVEEDPSIIGKMIKGYHETTQPTEAIKTKLKVRSALKSLLPPIVSTAYRKIRPHKNGSILWHGDFPDWSEVKKICGGYEDPSILQKTKTAVLKVKNGEAAGERDSVLFDKVQYSWPVITFLLKAAIENNNQLSVIDFGGSLGSSYFQARNMVPKNVTLSWNVVEQATYVEAGNGEIRDEHLLFYSAINEALEENQAHILLLSSVIQYLENPFEFIESILPYRFKYIILDRTAFIENSQHRLTVQNVPETIYKASYPAWFFNEESFKSSFINNYDIIADFDSSIDYPLQSDDHLKLYWKGFLLKLKDA